MVLAGLHKSQKGNKMKHKYLTLLAAAAVFLSIGTQSSMAHISETKITGLMNMPLSDIVGKDANMVLFEVAPGWTIANHFHPAHIFIYVIEGSIEITVEGQEPEVISAGGVVYELPDKNMVAKNVSSTEGAKFIVFTVGDIGEPVTVYVE